MSSSSGGVPKARNPRPAGDRRDPPPFLGSWPRVYWAVIFYLTLLITGFYFFTRAFNQ